MRDIPKSHPRYQSLLLRERVVEGVERGVVALQGLIAHGRGEAFYYLLGERSHPFAIKATEVALALMLTAKHPVISVNGNTAVLAPELLIRLAVEMDIPLEVNLFYDRERRERKVWNYLMEVSKSLNLEPKILIASESPAFIPELESWRRLVHSEGIYKADVVLVPLEDGDRTEALVKMGKKVIAIDLNPLSRTARMATITIVDELSQVLKNMLGILPSMRNLPEDSLHERIRSYSNAQTLREAISAIRENLELEASKLGLT